MTTIDANSPYLQDFRTVLGHVNRSGIVIVVLMILLSAVLDIVGIGMIIPFITVMTVGESHLPDWLPVDVAVVSRPWFGIGIMLLFVAKSILSYWLMRRIATFTEGERAKLMLRLMTQYLRQPYLFHLSRSLSDSINSLFWHSSSVAGATLGSWLRLTSDVIVCSAILVLLAMINAWATLALVAFLGTLGFLVAIWLRKEQRVTSVQIAEGQSRSLSILQDTLGSFREIRLLGTQAAFQERLTEHVALLASATARQNALAVIPKAVVEAALVSFLVALTMIITSLEEQRGMLIPLLSAMGVAALRLMPITTSILSNLNGIRISRFALGVLARELRTSENTTIAPEEPRKGSEEFHTLSLEGIGFRYPASSAPSLEDISLTINRGQIVGISGPSGSGKSTMGDILLGLLTPTSGRIIVDDETVDLASRHWQAQCAYVPQEVFLLSGSLEQNITFGQATNMARLNAAIDLAQLRELVDANPQGLQLILGERGKRLSGGQRQRVAIARALYFDRSLILMDEATSALDAATEAEIAQTIDGLRGNKTVILLTHSPRLLELCDVVIRISKGRMEAKRVEASA